MGAAVRIEGPAFDDPRFALLAKRLGIDKFSALGRMAKVWGYCTQAEAYWLPDVEFDVLFDIDGAADAAVESRLVERGEGENSGMVRVRGTRGRIEWKQKLRKNSKKGGAARKAKAKPDGSQKATQKEAKAEPELSPPSTTPSTTSYPHSPQGGGDHPGPIALDGEAALRQRERRALNKHRATAMRLWAMQDELRQPLGKNKLKPTAKRVARVAAVLEAGADEAEAERVLRHYAAEAKRTGNADWLNGETNWRPDNFDRALGMAADAPRETAENQGALASLFRGSDTPSFGDRDRVGDSR